MAFIGGVKLSIVENEQPQYVNNVTEKPVESGQNITDHVQRQPESILITCRLTGIDWREKLKRLQSAADRALLLTYNGKTRLDNAVIQNIYQTHDRLIADGVRLSITMRQIRIVEAREDVILAPEPVTPKVAGVSATVTQVKEYSPSVKTYLQERFAIPSLGDLVQSVEARKMTNAEAERRANSQLVFRGAGGGAR